MAGRLTIDFGNCCTVAAYWRQDFRRADVLYIPGVTRPAADGDMRVYLAPSLIGYGDGPDAPRLIGQEAFEGRSGLAADRKLFSNLQADVLTGKRVYHPVGGRRLSGQDIAKDYLAAVISRAGQALGLAEEAAITFILPAGACLSPTVCQRYARWLESAVRQAGYTRLEVVEQPWAAAWGAGMPVRPEDVYMVVNADTDMIETVIVQAIPGTGDADPRNIRVLSYKQVFLLEAAGAGEPAPALTALLQQTLRGAELLGYTAGNLAGTVVTGCGVQAELLAAIHSFFAAVPVYDRRPLTAAACGAAILTAGAGTCGYLRHSYGLRYLRSDGYAYHRLVNAGCFYPSDGPVADFAVKASYDGQQEMALFIYRLDDGEQCLNEDKPLILTAAGPRARGQVGFHVSVGVDSNGQLVATVSEAGSGAVVGDRLPVAKLE